MRYQVRCKTCGHLIWIRGTYEADTNALVLNDNDKEWDEACEHVKAGGDYEILDGEPIDDDD